MISSNQVERWLISITDMPLPAWFRRSARTRSRTGRGRAPGPAEKLWTRRVVWVAVIHAFSHAGSLPPPPSLYNFLDETFRPPGASHSHKGGPRGACCPFRTVPRVRGEPAPGDQGW